MNMIMISQQEIQIHDFLEVQNIFLLFKPIVLFLDSPH